VERASIHKINPQIYSITKAAARVFLAPFFEIRVEGRENVPRGGSFILLPKHQRWEDVPLLGLAVSRPLYYVAKIELFLNPLSKGFISSLGGIPLDRRRPLASRRSIRVLVDLLRGGGSLVIFPEGTYYRNSMGSGHVGLVRLICSQIRVPLIPVGIRYSREGMRRRVEIKFGNTIWWESSATPEAFLAMAMQRIRALSGL